MLISSYSYSHYACIMLKPCFPWYDDNMESKAVLCIYVHIDPYTVTSTQYMSEAKLKFLVNSWEVARNQLLGHFNKV